MPDPLWINADAAGEPAYNAAELRRGFAAALSGAGGVGARSGLRPGGPAAVTVTGTTVTVGDLTAVVDAQLGSASDGPYLVGHLSADHELDPADGANPRVDLVVLRIYDDDLDLSGLRTATSEVIAGTPASSPVPPPTPAGAIVLATVDVPQLGGGSPSVDYDPPYSVASGGVHIASAAGTRPSGPHPGLLVWRTDVGLLEGWTGAAWTTVADPSAAMGRQMGHDSETSEVAVASTGGGTTLLTVAATLSTGRRYRLEARSRWRVSDAGDRNCLMRIEVDGSVVAQQTKVINNLTASAGPVYEVVRQNYTPGSSGPKTINFQCERTVGATSLLSASASTQPAELTVTDIGPA